MGNLFSSSAIEDDDWKSDARYAMETGAYCVICGAPFDIEGDVYNLDPKEPRYQWLSRFRLLGKTESLNIHRLTSGTSEPLNTSGSPEIFLSERAEFQSAGSSTFLVRSDTGTDDILYNPLWYSRNDDDTLFPMHEACIETSCRVIDDVRHRHHYMDSEPTLAAFYNFLNTRYIDRHRKAYPNDEFSNDIFDLCHCSRLYGPRSVLAMTRLEWWGGGYDRFYTDPSNVPNIEAFVFDVLLASSQDQPTNVYALKSAPEPHGIERLPNELLDSICSYLPPQSVIKLHRTSKTMSEKLQLDNAFWRDRLRTGSLHPHIRGLDTQGIETLRQESNITIPAAEWDWKTVAKLLATKQFLIARCDPRLDKMPLGLWNRCRIWSIIERAFDYDYFGKQPRNRSDSGVDYPTRSAA